MAERDLRILDGDTYVLSDERGDLTETDEVATGFFHRDMRYLSRWRLTLDGQELESVSADRPHYFVAAYVLILASEATGGNRSVSVLRERRVGGGFREDIRVTNHTGIERDCELRIDAGCDFADIFEVRGGTTRKRGGRYTRPLADALVLGYARDDYRLETRIEVEPEATFDAEGVCICLHLPPQGSAEAAVIVTPSEEGERRRVKYGRGSRTPAPNMAGSLEAWLAEAPALECDWDPLRHTYRRSLTDLAALRFYPEVTPGESLPAAGLPWFMALFGRDSLVSSYEALPFVPELARTTLRALAARQATTDDPFRDQEPGKILHELRHGELTRFRERPQSPYYGAADTTPLFVVLLDEYELWTGDEALVGELEGNVRAALEWIDRYGDRDGDGYVAYERRNADQGLENQCWKDSWNSIVHPDGRLARLPRATCELQGHAYDAKLRGARLARRFFADPALADRLEDEAARLRVRFARDFWMEEERYFALALDGDKRQVRTVTSNPGRLLWSGILDRDQAEAVAERLMREDLYCGWGVRTMASGQMAYGPLTYHNGTVWPHDNALLAMGLRRYGFREEAARIFRDLLEAAEHFEHQLPELFAGFERGLTGFPVEYPEASRPQAWSSGAPLLLLRALLGIDPQGEELRWDPAVPDDLGRMVLRGVPGRWGRADVASEGSLEDSARR